MYTVSISDSCVEWAYELEGSESFSIDDLAKFMINGSKLRVKRSYITKRKPDEIKDYEFKDDKTKPQPKFKMMFLERED